MIVNSVLQDVPGIFEVYEKGIQFQKTVFHRHWFGFDKDLLLREITEGRHWKIMEDGEIACVFSVLYDDPIVWGVQEPSLYLHRIVTHPEFKGNAYVRDIVAWAKTYGKTQGKRFIRLDTFPDNEKLKNYYIRHGFRLCGIKQFDPGEKIPEHYRDGLSLFEIDIL